jgi:hypothetical protein
MDLSGIGAQVKEPPVYLTHSIFWMELNITIKTLSFCIFIISMLLAFYILYFIRKALTNMLVMTKKYARYNLQRVKKKLYLSYVTDSTPDFVERAIVFPLDQLEFFPSKYSDCR